jgi:hypothetical protein
MLLLKSQPSPIKYDPAYCKPFQQHLDISTLSINGNIKKTKENQTFGLKNKKSAVVAKKDAENIPDKIVNDCKKLELNE